MKYVELDDEIMFMIDSEKLGKWSVIDALEQTLLFWKTVAHYEVFRRKNFKTVTLKINRTSVFYDSSKQSITKERKT